MPDGPVNWTRRLFGAALSLLLSGDQDLTWTSIQGLPVEKITWSRIARRLWWDLQDPHERMYIGYWFIREMPGLFGNMVRSRFLARRMKRAGANLQVMAGCRFRSLENLEVGDNVNIGFDSFLQAIGGLKIGSNTSFAPGVKVWTTNHNIDDPDVPMRDQGQTHKPVSIGDDVYVGSNTFILPGTVLPHGCYVEPGAVVGGKPYRPYAILAGNPARIVGYRGGRTAASGVPAEIVADVATQGMGAMADRAEVTPEL